MSVSTNKKFFAQLEKNMKSFSRVIRENVSFFSTVGEISFSVCKRNKERKT
jgi:hypothetical protein